MYAATTGRFLSLDPLQTDGTDVLFSHNFVRQRTRHLAPNLQRSSFWTEHPYMYAWNNPMRYTDPSGLTPNQLNARDLSWLIKLVKSIEGSDAGACLPPTIALNLVANRFNDVKSKNSPAYHYIYTADYGWIDLTHFFNHAAPVTWVPPVARPAATIPMGALGALNEVAQAILATGYFIYPTDRNVDQAASAFTFEDFPSNSAGLSFGTTVSDEGCKCLSDQLEDFFKSILALPPKLAPDYYMLPVDEADNHRRYRENVQQARQAIRDAIINVPPPPF